MSTLVKGLGNISESFLTCCVPDVEGDCNPVYLDPFDFKIHSDGAKILMLKCVFTITDKKTCFSYSTVSYNQIFYCTVLGHRFFNLKMIKYFIILLHFFQKI